MAHLPDADSPRSELDGFLYADVGQESNGMPLTVLSLLARSGLDPWDEARRLCTLSDATAISCMADRIRASSARFRNRADLRPLAARLVTRLPGHEVHVAAQPGWVMEGDAFSSPLLIFVGYVAFCVAATLAAKFL